VKDVLRGIVAMWLISLGAVLWAFTGARWAVIPIIMVFWFQLESIRLNVGTLTIANNNEVVEG